MTTLRGIAVLLLALCSGAAHAESERERLATERAAANARLAEQERACAEKFVVTACSDAARKEHRATLARLRRAEMVLDDAASHWFGPHAPEPTVFHWHFDAFALPAGARLLARSAACPHQAFALGPHLAMQWHVELDEEKLQRWSHETSPRFEQACAQHPRSAQTGAQMRAQGARALSHQQALADHIYGRCLSLMP